MGADATPVNNGLPNARSGTCSAASQLANCSPPPEARTTGEVAIEPPAAATGPLAVNAALPTHAVESGIHMSGASTPLPKVPATSPGSAEVTVIREQPVCSGDDSARISVTAGAIAGSAASEYSSTLSQESDCVALKTTTPVAITATATNPPTA